VRLRPVTPEDAPAIAAIYGPYVRDTAISFEAEPPDAAAIRERFPRQHLWLVAERDAELLGYAYAGEFRSRAAYRWSTEMTVYVAPAAHRSGVGRALYGALFTVLEGSARGRRRPSRSRSAR
jgi:L-amino acid N-acyltransferase YncA